MSLLKGTLDVLVLKTLSWGPMHAFEIATWLGGRSDGRLSVEDAALMQALHRLEERGHLGAEWGTTEKGRRARYYRLTEAGRAHLKAETARLTSYVDALTTVLATRTARG
ncbi:MAG TPA: PadR family transcriptional regulator [Gemmatimonadaceae bacterium]|nr:PadR family transcriptional regulator [Gemmatimonadaceae bacterium]